MFVCVNICVYTCTSYSSSAFTFRVCLVLVVRGVDTYNDSITAAFRELAVSVSSDNRAPALSMAYIDEEKQEQFVGAFGGLGTLRSCAGGGKARPVSYVCAVFAALCH